MKSLPIIDIQPTYKLELPISKQIIHYKPYNVQKEKVLLTVLESGGVNADKLKGTEDIIKSCITEDIDFEKLSIIDFIMIVLMLRLKSKGSVHEFIKESCSNCKKSYDFSVNLEESIKFENKENVKSIIKISNDLSLEIKPLNYQFLYDIEDTENELELYINIISYCVSKIFFNKQIYTATPKDIKEKVLVNFTESNIKDIFTEYTNLCKVYLEIEYVCSYCGHKEKVKVSNFLGL